MLGGWPGLRLLYPAWALLACQLPLACSRHLRSLCLCPDQCLAAADLCIPCARTPAGST